MKKRLVALILCFFLTFQVGVIGYGQAVEAGEFIGEITTTFSSAGTALLTLMALLGVTPEVATVAAIGGVTAMGAYSVSKFEEYARQELGYTDDTIPNFLEDIKDGVVSTVSDGFSAFKSWIYSLSADISIDSSTNILTSNTPYTLNLEGNTYVFTPSTDVFYCHTLIKSGAYYTFHSYFFSLTDNFNLTYKLGSPSIYNSRSTTVNGTSYKYLDFQNTFSWRPSYTCTAPFIDTTISDLNSFIIYLNTIDFFNSSNIASDFIFNPGLSDYIGTGGTAGDLSLEDINDLPLSGTGSISINLENINEKLGSIESVLERIIAGEIPLTKVRDTAGVVPTTKDDVLTEEGTVPKDEYKGNEEDLPPKVVAPSYDPDDYKVTGLQNVFPFCIPFDLIDFIGVLKADPETPVFVINCSFLGKKFEDLTFTIDLKPFDPLAKICRYSELFLFCVGLIIVTRNIIKG